MEKMGRILCIAIALLIAVSICQAEESLDAKLAKLQAASNTTQSTRKDTDEAGSTAVTATAVEILDGKVNTLAEKLAELEARQKGMREVGKGLDARLDEFERRFEASKTQSQAEAQKAHDALYAKLAELESKIQGLEARSTTSSAREALPGRLSSKPQDKVEVPQASSGASCERETPTARVTASPNKVKPVEPKLKPSTTEPVAINLMDATAVDAPENVIGFEVTADFLGKYIWRGQNLSDDPVFQPGFSLSMGGFTGAWWGSADTSKINNNSGEFTEYDYSLDYSGDVPFVDWVGYSVGVINYYFPSGEDTTEVYWGFGFDLPLGPSITVYHDVDDVKGTYISSGLSHSIENVTNLGSDMPVGMDIGASLGWGSASYNKIYWGSTVKSGKLNDLALSVSFPFEIAGWSLAPSLNYVTLVNGNVRETDTYNNGSDYFFGGISAAKCF